ncbi:MAG: hypothetical protein ACLRMJ_00640 [Alistipes finegoldii]
MHKFTCGDIGDLHIAVAEALKSSATVPVHRTGAQQDPADALFNSVSARASTQKAAMNLGMNVMVLDVNQGHGNSKPNGVVMDGDKAEHLLEAIPVMGSYCDVIGVRSFASSTKAEDYEDGCWSSSSAIRAVPSSRWRPPRATRCKASPT